MIFGTIQERPIHPWPGVMRALWRFKARQSRAGTLWRMPGALFRYARAALTALASTSS